MTDHAKSADEGKTKEQLVRELKSLREKVADTDRLLAELIRNYKEVPIGLCHLDTDLRFIQINAWLAAIYGVPVEEHLGRTLREVLPDVAGGIEPQLRHVIETGEPILGGTVEAETPAQPGIRRTFRHNYYPLKSGDDTIVGVSCVVEDVTAQKRAEDALRENEARYRDFTDASSDWFWEMDADLRFTWFSESVQEVAGVPPEWHYGKTREEIGVPVVDPEGLARHLETLRRREPYRDFVFKRRGPDGDKWLRSSGIPVFDDNGVFKGYRGTGSDITEHKQMEMELLQAQKMDLVGQLTGGIAHDFNNLLAVILGNLELIEEELAGNESVGELLQWAIGAADNAADLTQRLLAFSRKQPLRPRSTRVNKLVGKLAKLSRRTLGETIRVKTALARDLWATYVDPGQLEAALLNLVVNARDAMPKGGKITIETRNRTVGEDDIQDHAGFGAGDYVMIAVSDTGTGMPPEVIERVFEPFFTTKDIGKGSGLGLSMVYGFVRQSGGQVTIDSEVGEGTTVRLYLPRADETEAPEPAVPGRSQHRGRGQSILVVEDDANVRALAVRVIEGLGYRVRVAANASSALEILAERPEIELLFTDVVLTGGMGGADLAREARRLRPELHVLYASGYTEDAIMRHGWLDDGVELIEKPYRKETLAGALGTILGADAAGRAARP